MPNAASFFSRLIKEITIAAREGGNDPDGNPRVANRHRHGQSGQHAQGQHRSGGEKRGRRTRRRGVLKK